MAILNAQTPFFQSMVKKHHDFVLSHGKEVFKSLSKYTSTIVNKRINKNIRKQKPLSVDDRKIVDDIDNLYSDVEPTTQTLTLYRGLKDKSQVKSDGTFISASYNIDVAKAYMDQPKKCCLIILNIPAGSKVLFIQDCSFYWEEDEVLIDRKGDFSVTLIKEDENGFTHIFVTYIPKDSIPAPPNIQDILQIGKLSPTNLSLSQLKLKAKMLGCKGYSHMTKIQLAAFVRTCKKSPFKSHIKSPIKSLSPSKINLVQLRLKAKKLGCKGYSNMKKDQLVAFVKTCKKSPLK